MGFSLLSGWLPWTVQFVAAAALACAIGARDRRWWSRTAPTLLAVSAVAAAVTDAALHATVLTDPVPATVWAWGGATLCAVLVLVVGWRAARWWWRGVGVLALVLAVVASAVSLNAFIGYYPTVAVAAADLSDRPVPGQISLARLPTMIGHTSTGRVVQVDIPDTASHFAHRPELVYLPPVWFRSARRPALPVVEMIGGEFAAPANWIRAGHAQEIADRYAAAHGGVAPILVFADATGGFHVDTECVNGVAGRAQDHLTKDIPAYVESTFGASADPAHWAVAGWSMGGTCAVTLTLAHPEIFHHFLDISGDLGPNIGDRPSTISHLYGGDVRAWAANDPLTVLRAHGRYEGVSGRFEQGTDEAAHIAQAGWLLTAARQQGVTAQEVQRPGMHNWEFGSRAFDDAFPWLCGQLGLTSEDVPSRRR